MGRSYKRTVSSLLLLAFAAGAVHSQAGEISAPMAYINARAVIITGQGSFPVTGPAATFNQNRINPILYPHQGVGIPYTIKGRTYAPHHNPDYNYVGIASWYGGKFHGRKTANGEIYDKGGMTAAHKTLPLNSFVIVTSQETGRSVKLRINDRGPFAGERIIDLSEGAADVLGIKNSGLGRVRVQYAGPAPKMRKRKP